MATQTLTLGSEPLPAYVADAKPNPATNRAPWYKNTAPTYAGVFLWFVFWDTAAANGLSMGGLAIAMGGVFIGALICHYLFYYIPGLLGMKTGLPLYIVGTSTFGTMGGLLMPGLLMGVLQFGWLGVNTYYSCDFLSGELVKVVPAGRKELFYGLCVIFAIGAAFIGLKGIQYVAKVATFLPLIPLAVLLAATVYFGFSSLQYAPDPGAQLPEYSKALAAMVGMIVGFFATAGAAGVDFGMNSQNEKDVGMGGMWGILLATLITAGLSTVAVAGAHVTGALPNQEANAQKRSEMLAQGKSAEAIEKALHEQSYTLTYAIKAKFPKGLVTAIMIGLVIAAFPGACFSSFIAANSFKTVMPQVNPFLSVGIGAVVSIILAVTEVAGDLKGVFGIIGASFGPICGAMCADYLLAGGKWSGPRAGCNPAGWVAWLLGFVVGIMPNLHNKFPNYTIDVPASAVAAFVVGAVVYFVLATIGLQSRLIPYAPATEQRA